MHCHLNWVANIPILFDTLVWILPSLFIMRVLEKLPTPYPVAFINLHKQFHISFSKIPRILQSSETTEIHKKLRCLFITCCVEMSGEYWKLSFLELKRNMCSPWSSPVKATMSALHFMDLHKQVRIELYRNPQILQSSETSDIHKKPRCLCTCCVEGVGSSLKIEFLTA